MVSVSMSPSAHVIFGISLVCLYTFFNVGVSPSAHVNFGISLVCAYRCFNVSVSPSADAHVIFRFTILCA